MTDTNNEPEPTPPPSEPSTLDLWAQRAATSSSPYAAQVVELCCLVKELRQTEETLVEEVAAARALTKDHRESISQLEREGRAKVDAAEAEAAKAKTAHDKAAANVADLRERLATAEAEREKEHATALEARDAAALAEAEVRGQQLSVDNAAEEVENERRKTKEARAVTDGMKAEYLDAVSRAKDLERDFEEASKAFVDAVSERERLEELLSQTREELAAERSALVRLSRFLSDSTPYPPANDDTSSAAIHALATYQGLLEEAGSTIESRDRELAATRRDLGVLEEMKRKGKLAAANYVREGLKAQWQAKGWREAASQLFAKLEQIERLKQELREALPVGVPPMRTFQHRALKLAAERRFVAVRGATGDVVVLDEEQRNRLLASEQGRPA